MTLAVSSTDVGTRVVHDQARWIPRAKEFRRVKFAAPTRHHRRWPAGRSLPHVIFILACIAGALGLMSAAAHEADCFGQ